MTLYHATMYDDGRLVDSYWEATGPDRPDYPALAGDERCDVAVIGGGYTGLSAALHLARDHGIDVRVLEAGAIGWAASGRNGGFCTIGASKLSIAQMDRRFGAEETARFHRAQIEAVDLVDAFGRDEGIDYDRRGDGVFEVAHRAKAAAELRETMAAYRDRFGIPVAFHEAAAFDEIGHRSTEQHGALHIGVGFGLHPLKFAAGLAAAAARRGARLHAGSRVVDWINGRPHVLRTAGGSLRADRVIVATNGYSRDRLHPGLARRFIPAISNIVTTRPLTAAELDAQGWRTECPVSNTRSMLFYYRVLPDRTFLFGARGDTTGRPADAERMKKRIVCRLGEVFPAWRDVPIAHCWRGFVCLTARLTPAVGRLDDDPSVLYGYGYHGNGVAMAPWTGRALARLVISADHMTELPAVMTGLPRRLPPGPVRRWGLDAAYMWYRLTDDR